MVTPPTTRPYGKPFTSYGVLLGTAWEEGLGGYRTRQKGGGSVKIACNLKLEGSRAEGDASEK